LPKHLCKISHRAGIKKALPTSQKSGIAAVDEHLLTYLLPKLAAAKLGTGFSTWYYYWLLRHHRACPSAFLDKCSVFKERGANIHAE
jgi:hypothetical protein